MTLQLTAELTCVIVRLFCRHWSSPQRQSDTQVGEGHDAQWYEIHGTKKKYLVGSLLLV